MFIHQEVEYELKRKLLTYELWSSKKSSSVHRFKDLLNSSGTFLNIEKRPKNCKNVFKFGKFLIVLFMAAFTGAGHFIIHIASHTNRFVHGLSGLIRSMTPFLLGTIHILRNQF